MIQLAGQTEPAAEETQGASGSGPPPGKTRWVSLGRCFLPAHWLTASHVT